MISPKKRSITHAWKLLGEKLIKYWGHRILLAAMSCCLRSFLNSLERVRTTDSFSRTDGCNEYMVELSSALSVLFTTMEGYYQHLKGIISAFGNVQSTIERYHHHLEEHYYYSRRCSSHWRGKQMIDLLMFFCSINDISLRHWWYPHRSTDGIINVRLLHGASQQALLDFDDGGALSLLGLPVTECNLQGKYINAIWESYCCSLSLGFDLELNNFIACLPTRACSPGFQLDS